MALTKVTYGLISADTSAIDLNIDQNTLYVETSGNRVGIGTTSPSDNLHVVGDIRINSNTPQLKFTSADNSSNSYYIGANISDSVDGGLQIGEGTALGSNVRLAIDGSGNVLVGTTDNNVTNNTGNNPGINLGVAGIKGYIAAARYQGAPLALNRLGNDGDVAVLTKDGVGVGVIGTQNWGIGTTSPSGTLHISGGSSTFKLTDTGITDANHNTLVAYAAAQNKFALGVSSTTGTSADITIDGANNRVGIGTTSPDNKLHIKSSSESLQGLVVENTSTGGASSAIVNLISAGNTEFQLQQYIDGSGRVRNRANAPLQFYTNNTEHMRINSSGNVGIGTSSPNTALHVLSDGAGEQAVARFQNTNTNSHNLYIKVDDDNNLVQFQSTGSNNGGFKFTGGNTDIVHISSAGKVVVSPIQSTTNSSQLLNVVNNGEAGIGIESPNGSSPRTWELIVGGSGGVFAGGKFGIFNRTASTAAITVDGNNNVVFSSTIDADSINIDGQAAGGNVLTFENNSWIAIKDGSGTHRRSMGASGDSLYIGDVDNQFDATYLIGQQRPDTTMTVTSYGGGAPDYNNSMMLSGDNTQNLWLLVDGANNTWGLYHRNIDSTETYSTDEPLRPNSIAWVGQGRLSGYFTLENKIGGATTQASYVRGGLAGVYHDYKFKSDTGFEIGKGDDGEPVHTPTINERSSASTGVNATVGNGSPGVYWLNFNGKRFRAYIRPNWLQGRNWVLAAKWFSHTDMPSGSSYWTNDTYHNEGDFNILSGLWSKYLSWRYFSFDRLAMQMGDRVAPIMQFGSAQTLYGAFSGGRAANGGGVSPTSTDPALSTGATYHGMTNFMGGTFTDLGGLEDKMQSYGLNKWANNSLNGTSANNQGSRSLTAGGKGFELTIEDSHDNISGNNSIGFAGAWIGCPLDESNCNPLATSSNAGADSGFGFGGGCGNNARTWTSGIAEWSRGNEVANYHPAYVWLSID